MNATGAVSTAVGVLTIAACVSASRIANAQLPVQRTLDQIDSIFVCPESLPNDEARTDALRLFLDELASVQPTITPRELANYRVDLLRKHHCQQTLANIGSSPEALTPTVPAAAPTTNGTDHWERAGRMSGPNGWVISVDMDSMTSAGPGKMRTWMKFHFNTLGPKKVKESLAYEQLDCSRRYHSTISLYNYGRDGQIIFSAVGKAEDEEPIIPESMLAGILPFTCAAHGLSVGR